MNKLDVSLKLIRLLNERSRIDSAVVANELNVSLRTAQRYLLELSALPCVMAEPNKHYYSLAKDYKIKEVLLNYYNCENILKDLRAVLEGVIDIKRYVCSTCGITKRDLLKKDTSNYDNEKIRIEKINDLLCLVDKMLLEKTCLLK